MKATLDTAQPLSGPPTMTLKRTKILRILVSITLLPVAVLFLATFVGTALDETAGTGVVVFSLVGAAVTGIPVFLLFRRDMLRVTRLYADGIEQKTGRKVKVVRWDRVEQVWFRAIRVQSGGIAGFAVSAGVRAMSPNRGAGLSQTDTHINVKVVSPDESILLTSNDRGVAAACEEILHRVNPRLFKEQMRLLEAGQDIAYGKVTINRSGLRLGGRKSYPWNRIKELSIKNGKLYVKVQDKRLAVGGVPIHKIPNVFLLTEIAGGFLGSRPPQESARKPTAKAAQRRIL